MSRSLYVRGTKVEDGRAHELVIVDGVVAGAAPPRGYSVRQNQLS